MSDQKQLVIVTGFNRGFGESITKLLIDQFTKNEEYAVDFVLISRVACHNVDQLVQGTSNKRLVATNWQVDFSLDEDLEKLSLLIKGLDACYRKVLLFSNAGALGQLDLTVNIDLKSIENATRINYFGPVCLVTGIMNKFLNQSFIQLVNISSLAAIQAFKGWSTYCSTKSAASLFFKCIAKEQDATRVKVLNYAPGPLDTRMQTEIRDGMKGAFAEEAKYWADLKESNGLIDPKDSAAELLKILHDDTFESGAHIDYYDVVKG